MKLRLPSLTIALALAAGLTAPAAGTSYPQRAPPAAELRQADLKRERTSAEVRHVADWAVHSGDHKRLPFIIVDKVNAKLYAFDAHGRLIRATAVLLGMGRGDVFPPGVVNMDMYHTKPWQRVTPAGRYFAEEDRNLEGELVLWVDYDNGIAIHKLPAKRTKQRRHERIRSPNPADHRITYGCINVPPAYYDQVVRPYFAKRGGIVYVLPEKAPLRTVLKTYDVKPRSLARVPTAADAALPALVRTF